MKTARTQTIPIMDKNSRENGVSQRQFCGKFILVKADGIIYFSPDFKHLYLFRYKLVFYVLYIPGIVGQHTNIFLIIRVG